MTTPQPEIYRIVTADRLRELLDYDPLVGEFRWRVGYGGRRVGRFAGSIDWRGYRVVRVDGEIYQAHRLAWLYVNGDWPSCELDHVNRKKSDNRIANLRLATHSQNMANVDLRRNNTSGFKGVRFQAGKWVAEIQANRQRIYLGRYATANEAVEAYEGASQKYHGEFAP